MLTSVALSAVLFCPHEVEMELADEPSSLISTHAMLEYLDSVEKAQEGLKEAFIVEYYSAHGSAEPPETLDPAHFVYSQRIISLTSKERFRIEVSYIDAHATCAEMKGQFHVLTWNGVEGRFTTLGAHLRDLTQQGGRIQNLPGLEFHVLPIVNWSGSWVFQSDYYEGFADLLRTSTVIGPRSAESGTTEWRIVSKFAEHGEILLTAGKHDDGKPILLKAVYRVFKSKEAFDAEDASELIGSNTLEYDGPISRHVRLKRIATLTQRHWRGDGNANLWGVATITLVDAEKVEISDRMFLADLAPNAIVADTRFNVAYQLGTRDLNVDGRLLETHIPLEGNVGDRIQWWLERAKPYGASQPDTIEKLAQPESKKE